VLKTSAINGNEKKNSAVDIPNTKSGQKSLKGLKIKKKVPLSKAQAQPRYLLGSSGWQKKKLQRLSAHELKEKGMAWVPKGSTQTQEEDDVHTEGAVQLKKKKRSKRRSSNIWFAPNHQNYLSVHRPFDLKCHIRLCLGIHPSICLVIPHTLILIFGCHVGLYIMEGYHQIVMPID